MLFSIAWKQLYCHTLYIGVLKAYEWEEGQFYQMSILDSILNFLHVEKLYLIFDFIHEFLDAEKETMLGSFQN